MFIQRAIFLGYTWRWKKKEYIGNINSHGCTPNHPKCSLGYIATTFGRYYQKQYDEWNWSTKITHNMVKHDRATFSFPQQARFYATLVSGSLGFIKRGGRYGTGSDGTATGSKPQTGFNAWAWLHVTGDVVGSGLESLFWKNHFVSRAHSVPLSLSLLGLECSWAMRFARFSIDKIAAGGRWKDEA